MSKTQPDIVRLLPDLPGIWADTLGDPEIRVAVLDGPVDLSHPCFDGAQLQRLRTLVSDPAGTGAMSAHGTHVASVIFGQPNAPVVGVAPRCQGLVLPVFRDHQEHRLLQLDLARAIEQAVEAGAHIINISGGERSPEGQADDALARAVRLCEQRNVLVVAAAGNDGCACLHVPAALPAVLVVGAMGGNGQPMELSNWGDAYRENGVLAPGENVPGAVPGGGVASFTGSSFATPIIAGLAALLLSLQRQSGQEPDPHAVREIILESARKCEEPATGDCARYLAGTLNVLGAYSRLTKGRKATMSDTNILAVSQTSEPDGFPPGRDPKSAWTAGIAASSAEASDESRSQGSPQSGEGSLGGTTAQPTVGASTTPPGGSQPFAAVSHAANGVNASAQRPASSGVVPAADCGCDMTTGMGMKSNIFAIGTVGIDYRTEAIRDSFRQLMPQTALGTSPPTFVPPNPYDTNQLVAYLNTYPAESTKLTWTLNLELTPIYAIEAEIAYAESVYSVLRSALAAEALPFEDPNYVSRASIAGVMTNRTVRLFSGQVVPVVVATPYPRGLYTWNESALINAVIAAVVAAAPQGPGQPEQYTAAASVALRNFLDKIYYQLRNLGQTSSDRALNYAATNAFQSGEGLLKAIYPSHAGLVVATPGETGLYTFDTITTAKSPFCRIDSDCVDVMIRFFDPENERRARTVLQYTIDVSDEMPVSLGPTRYYAVAA
jgi:cyanobactin maturation PatA/PatG family protease